MKARKLDSNYDYVFGNNSQDYLEGPDAVAIAVRTKILLFYKEWWEDRGIGIPMFESILGQVSKDNVRLAATNLLTKRVMEVPEVKSVTSVDILFHEGTRSMTVQLTIQYGTDNETLSLELEV